MKKGTEKVALLQVKGLISIVVKLPSFGPVVFIYDHLFSEEIQNLF